MKLSKVTFESFYFVWKIILKVIDAIYTVVVAVDNWIEDHKEK